MCSRPHTLLIHGCETENTMMISLSASSINKSISAALFFVLRRSGLFKNILQYLWVENNQLIKCLTPCKIHDQEWLWPDTKVPSNWHKAVLCLQPFWKSSFVMSSSAVTSLIPVMSVTTPPTEWSSPNPSDGYLLLSQLNSLIRR